MQYKYLVSIGVVLLLALSLISTTIITTAEAYPKLNRIIFISYQGNDQAGATAFIQGQINAYLFQLPPNLFGGSFPKNVSAYPFPGTLYNIVVNPLNTSFGFNPFMFQEVRFALNFIIDRNYFINTLLGGYGIPIISPYGGELDAIVVANATGKYSFITYNLTYANITIYKALTAHGAKMINGMWYYGDKPITIYVFIRTDDAVRKQLGLYLVDQLKKLGFTVQTIEGDLAKAYDVVYGPDPVNSTWNIYTEAWGGVYAYYDEGLAINMYSTLIGNLPATSYYGLTWGTYNDSKYELPSLISTINKIDLVAMKLINYNYSSKAERDSLLNQLVDMGINSSIRIFIAQSILPVFTTPNLSGVNPDFAFGSLLGYQSYLTMSSPTGEVKFGVRFLSRGAWNPVGGFSDAYTDQIALGTVVPLTTTIPGNGYAIPFGFTFKIVNYSLTPSIPVPSDALIYNVSAHTITTVGEGVKAKAHVIFDFSPYLKGTKWQDGQPVTLADVIYQYIAAARVALDDTSGVYEDAANAVYAPSLQQIVGFKIINSTAIEIWSNVWYFDPNYIAYNTLGSFLPLGYALPGGGNLPWVLYVGMEKVVQDGKAAWFRSTASAKGIDWLSLVSPQHVKLILYALGNYSSVPYIPKPLLDAQRLSGVTLIDNSTAKAEYSAAISFIQQYGHALIGSGPYILQQYSPQLSPPQAILVKSPHFAMNVPKEITTPIRLFALTANIPSLIPAGSSISGKVLQTPIGSTTSSPAPNATVVIQVTSAGKVILTATVNTGNDGSFSFTLPSTLPAGQYNLVIYVYTPDSILTYPYVYSTLVTPAQTTTTPPGTTITTTPPQTTPAAGGGIDPTIIIAIVVIIIIIIIAVILLRRR